MNKAQQIEEMARTMAGCGKADCLSCKLHRGGLCSSYANASAAYAAGYRKQEWISVDERLPTAEENDRGLVGIVTGHNGKIGFVDAIILVDYDFEERGWWSEDYDITNCKVEYWMPLPEPPKMKGGAE